MSADDALTVTLRVAALLDGLGVTYAVVGSLASSFHGIPRSTHDADLLAALEERHIEPWLASLAHAYYVDAERVRQAVATGSSFNIIYLATMFKVDIFVLGEDRLSVSELGRRQRIELETPVIPAPASLWIASAEDTVLHKLLWYRLGGEQRSRQWRDAVGVLEVQGGALDRGYLERWAAELGLGELLDRARRESGEP